jgi:hypothetical protein
MTEGIGVSCMEHEMATIARIIVMTDFFIKDQIKDEYREGLII